MEPPPTTLARTVSWSIASNSGHTQPGKAGPYAHHLGPVRRGEACLALVGAAAVVLASMAELPLAERHCVPCERGTPPMPADQAGALLLGLQGWEIEHSDGHDQLAKAYRFPDFVRAVEFVNRITPVAEAEGHHPDLLVTWGRVRVQLWTHAARGLTENDFVLAAKIDRLTGS